MIDLLEAALSLRKAGKRFAFVTIVEAEGSTPRHVGAKMIVCEDGSIVDTIGGGNLETEVIARAKEAMASGRAARHEIALGPALGQCCGGRVAIFVEPDQVPDRLYLFGAGHTGKELSRAAAQLGFKVVSIDPRADWNSAERMPDAERLLEDGLEAIGHLAFDARNTYCAVMTHNHRDDEEIVRALLDKPLRYLGLIGSKTKWARFRQRYQARGHTDAQIARVRTPIGLDIKAETPAEIAMSIAAELVQVRRTALSVVREAAPAVAASLSASEE